MDVDAAGRQILGVVIAGEERPMGTATVPKRKYFISGHSVTQLRERSESPARWASVRDEVLNTKIHRAVEGAFGENKFEEIYDEGKLCWLVDLRTELEEELWGVVKLNDRPDISERFAVVTLLPERFVKENQKSGRWTPRAMSKEDNVANVSHIRDALPRPTSYFVHYRKKDDITSKNEEFVDPARLEDRVNDLYDQDDIDPDSIRVSKEVKLKRKLVITEEL